MTDDELTLFQTAHAGLGAVLKNQKPSTEQSAAVEKVLKMLRPKQRRMDDVELALYAKARDGNEAERAEVQAAIIEAARLAREDMSPQPLFKAAPRKMRGKFFT